MEWLVFMFIWSLFFSIYMGAVKMMDCFMESGDKEQSQC